MTTLVEVEAQIAAEVAAVTKTHVQIEKLHESVLASRQNLNVLYDTKYEMIDPAIFSIDQMALIELVEDAQLYRAPSKALDAWVQTFHPRFHGAGRRSSGGALPSTTVHMNQNEVVDPTLVEAIQKFSQMVHGDSNYVVFDIMEHTCSEFGSYYLMVYGENYDKATLVSHFDLRNLTYNGYVAEDEIEDSKTITEVLEEMAKTCWYREDITAKNDDVQYWF